MTNSMINGRAASRLTYMLCLGLAVTTICFAEEGGPEVSVVEKTKESGLPLILYENEKPSQGKDQQIEFRDGELFGREVEEILVAPELEEGEVVERGQIMKASSYPAYDRYQLSAKALRIPLSQTQLCRDKVITRSVSAYPMASKVHGDRDMGDNKVFIVIEGEVEHTNGRVFIRGDVSMDEEGGNRSEFRHTFDQVIFDATREAPGCRITGVSFNDYNVRYMVVGRDAADCCAIEPTDGGRITGHSPAKNYNFRTYYPPPGGTGSGQSKWQLFASASCRADTSGSDGGEIGCNQIQVRPLKVHLAPIENGKACQRVYFKMPANNMSMYNRGFRDLFPIARVGGDSTLNGKATGFAIANVEWNQDRIQLYHRVRIRENGGDHSTYDSASRSTLIEAAVDAPGCKIKSVEAPALKGRADFSVDSKWWLGHGGTGLLERVWCRVNSNASKDDWRLGCTQFEYKHNLNITFE